jgi:integrase
MILATTALRISEVAGLQVGDVDLLRGLLAVRRGDVPGPRRPGHQGDQGPAASSVPIIEPLRATLERLTVEIEFATP